MLQRAVRFIKKMINFVAQNIKLEPFFILVKIMFQKCRYCTPNRSYTAVPILEYIKSPLSLFILLILRCSLTFF